MSEGFDFNALLEQAVAVQRQLADAQQRAASQTVEGHAGGGAVLITMTGAGQVTAVHIDPAAVEEGDAELLEDLVLAAFRDAQARVDQLRQSAVGDLGPGLSGLGPDLGGLSGLPRET